MATQAAYTGTGGNQRYTNSEGFIMDRNSPNQIETASQYEGKKRRIGSDGTVYVGGVATDHIKDGNMVRGLAPKVAAPQKVTSATAGSAGTTRHTVGDDEIGEKRLEGMLSRDSALMQRARAEGNRYANSRGLLNSSIGSEASMGAMVDRAAPIAMGDAATFNKTGLANMAEANANARANAQNATQVGIANAGYANSAEQQRYGLEQGFNYNTQANDQQYKHQQGINEQNFENQSQLSEQQFGQQYGLNTQQFQNTTQLNSQQFEHQIGLDESKYGQEYALQQVKGRQAVDLMRIESDYKNLLQTNQSSAALLQEYMRASADVLSNKDLKATQLNSALSTQKKQLETALNVMSGLAGVDLSKFQSAGYQAPAVSQPVASTGVQVNQGATTPAPTTGAQRIPGRSGYEYNRYGR